MRPHLELLSGTQTRDKPSPANQPHTLASLLAHRPADSPAAPAPHDPVSHDDVIDVAGVARLLRVGRNKVYEMVSRNEIPHRRFGRRIRFSRAAIMRWLDSWSPRIAKEGQ